MKKTKKGKWVLAKQGRLVKKTRGQTDHARRWKAVVNTRLRGIKPRPGTMNLE